MNFSNDWILLPGGSVNTVAIKDNVVRRQLTNVSPAIHQLLEYLKVKNFPCVPRLINYDDRYEYLSYLPGKAILRPWCNAIKTDDFIRHLGKWLKDYHEVITGFI